MKDVAFNKIKKELLALGLQKELAEAIYKLVIESDKNQCTRLVAKIIAQNSGGKLSEKLIIWILNTI